MARDPAVSDDGVSSGANPERADYGDNNTLLDRRSYLKLAGATTAAATAVTAATGAASAADYDVIRAQGQTINIGSGETFENKLIDLTTGSSVLLMVNGANSTIRNVGFKGLHRGDGFMISINAGRGDVLVENVYLGDGSTKEGADFVHGPGAVFMHRNNNADVTFRRCNVQGWPNNAFYCSNTAHGGSARFEYCFGKNNGVSTYRVASGNDAIIGCVAYNDNTDYGQGYGGYGETNGRPVWVWNGGTVTIRDSNFSDGPYPYALVAGANNSPGRANFESGGYSGNIRRGAGSTVTVGSAVSSAPDLSIPDGVPTSAEAAASSGERRTRGDHENLQHTYEFVAEGESEPTDYYFEVEEGPIEPSSYNGATIEPEYTWVNDDGTRAAGRVVDGRHAWEFDSPLVDVTVDGPATPLVNDRQSNLDRYPRSGAAGDGWKGDMPWHATDSGSSDEPDGGSDGTDGSNDETTDDSTDESTDGEREFEHTYEFVAEGESEPTDYYFEVEEGPIEPSTYNGATVEESRMWVSDDGTRAAGRVADGRHAWAFDSLLVDVTVDGPAEPLVDDRQSNLDRYPQSGATGDGWKGDMPWHHSFEHTYEFVAEGESEPTDYYFEVEEGPIEPSTYNGATVEESRMWVSDDGTRAAGRVVDGRHAWEFDSLLVDVTVDGPAEPLVDDRPSYLGRYPLSGATGDGWKGDMPWHAADDPVHTLLIDGVGIIGKTSYDFRVSGDAEPTNYQGASINDDTSIVDGRVSGSLRGWRDAFEFSGDLESLTINGSARVYLDDERVDPNEYGEELDHVLTIVSNGSPASYEVSVDGRIAAIAGDDSSEAASIRDGRTAVGSIDAGYHRFRYSGSVTDLAFDEGTAFVYADQDRITPDDY
ncbi:hypothetical protein HT576_15735 [Haloterrigena sp. SYSU A121-1]|uniref:Uncharacterized protein n=1 Tax=Haloterrigena gelatinilytica TaxID=2741724 RepID=A0A8J8GM05_9EURY|nr:hypothetical protein [Haloterrigena gelatinilytica]NUB92464.1 hypothetical protein [Haloterrigena gelatinilytica]